MIVPLMMLLLAPPEPPDAEAMMIRTGERFFAMQAYSVEVKQQRFNPGVSMSSGRMALHRADGDRWRVETGKGSFAIGNEEGWLVYSEDRRTYYRMEAGPQVRFYKDLVQRNVARFERLGLLAKSARFVRWENVKRDLRTYRCAVLELRSPAEDEMRWVELLWIDPEERLVLRSNFEVFGPNGLPGMEPRVLRGEHPVGTWRGGWGPGSTGVTVTDYRWLRLDAPESEELFRFVPPKGSREVAPPGQK